MVPNFLMFLGMLTVLIVILICAYYATRFVATRMGDLSPVSGGAQKLALVHRLPLGRDQQLVVVKVANRHVVIGCTPNQISMILELTQDESEEFFSRGQEEGNVKNFTEILQSMREKKKSKDENEAKKD